MQRVAKATARKAASWRKRGTICARSRTISLLYIPSSISLRRNFVSRRPLIFIELSEINFDLVRLYLDKYRDRFPALRTLLSQHSTVTSAEEEYENLEPWVQWPSVHTGLSFNEHRIFRLGDVVESGAPQFFEQVERAGYSVGAVSPMNAANRLQTPAYFVPDPWTRTAPDRSIW